jgi:hypothetical protein
VRSGRPDRAGDDRHGSHPRPAPAGVRVAEATHRAAGGRSDPRRARLRRSREVVAAIGKAATVIPGYDESGPAAAELADAGMTSRP